MSRQAFKFEAEVGPRGKLEFSVPLPQGTTVEVVVLAGEVGEHTDLVEASTSSTEFWDNPIDDAEWNNA